MDEQRKLTNLFRDLWRDAEDEGRSLRALLRGAQEDVCSLNCRSYFPAGHIHSDADHSDKCRAIKEALNDADADATDRVAVAEALHPTQQDASPVQPAQKTE